jgi:predicted O-linked N-acetylglucosamine transferase (SPINDLY family)
MSSRPLRVGFISYFFNFHTIGKLHEGFIRHLDRERFHVTVFRFGPAQDEFGRLIDRSADKVVVLPKHLDSARRLIAQQALDLLYYTDVGMESITYFLAFSRLAHVQCTGWGHPMTTGIPNLDWFISSVLIEPPGAERHYTEKLALLSVLPTCYERPKTTTPDKPRSAFGLADNEHVYLCPQSLFKIHPDFDKTLARILADDPAGRLVLVEGLYPVLEQNLRARFARLIPDQQMRVHVVPRQAGDDFMHLMAVSDVLLDPPHFSGGNTSLEAFSLGKAVVTLPGPFMRARVTYGMYRQMGLNDCVAKDEADYVRLAVSLANNPRQRGEIERTILEHSPKLFGNLESVRELERFFERAVEVTTKPTA